MMEKLREQIIRSYLQAYNNFDVAGMVADFDEDIEFKNVANDRTDLEIFGLDTFIKQAEAARQFFSQREQAPISFSHHGNNTVVLIKYKAILAFDLPSGLKSGDSIEIKAKSTFVFEGNKIKKLIDES